MAVKKILLLGNPFLYTKSEAVTGKERHLLKEIADDLNDTLLEFRKKYGVGRAIAAPQIGIGKRIILMNTGKPILFVNPEYEFMSEETFELWDDCMSFPDLLVRVDRSKKITIKFLDENFETKSLTLEADLSELLQHEMDHLDGVLAVMRAKDKYSYKYKERSI